MTNILDSVSKLAGRRKASAPIDINADFTGSRPTGDPRLDLAMAGRR